MKALRFSNERESSSKTPKPVRSWARPARTSNPAASGCAYPPRLAEEFLRHAPETIALFDRSGNREYSLGAELSRIMRADASRNEIDRLPDIGG
jgi:hypothetical protein